jgi:hypothetical protein
MSRNEVSHWSAGTHQSVAYTGTAGIITNGVGGQIRAVRVVCTSAAYIAFNATATTAGIYVPANTPEVWQIEPGDKVSAIQVSSGGTLHVTELDS